jgi:phosphate transport system substrate-binding protein
MRKIISVAACMLVLGAGTAAAEDPVLIGGSGGAIPVTVEIVKAYQAKHPSARIEVNTRSMGSSGGIKAAEAGKVGIALTTRALKAEENPQGTLVQRIFGRLPVLFGVHPSQTVNGLTQQQVCDIYGGKIRSWKEIGGADGRILVLTRNEDDSSKSAVRQQMRCFKDLKEVSEAIVMTSDQAMGEGIAKHPATIGISNLGTATDMQGRFKILALDGVAPSVETVSAGKYPVFAEFGVVIAKQPTAAVKSVVDFMSGPEGRRILNKHGIAGL